MRNVEKIQHDRVVSKDRNVLVVLIKKQSLIFPGQHTMAVVTSGRKCLVGVESTPELRSWLDLIKEKANNHVNLATDDASAVVGFTPDAVDSVVQSTLWTLSPTQAARILEDYFATDQSEPPKTCIPIPVIRAARTFHATDTTHTAPTRLVFHNAPPRHPPRSAADERRYQSRLERLRRQHESHQYRQLTTNILHRTQHDDDITTKSMTYAASIGLNMIIAPLSFGAFMYHFGGSLLEYLFVMNTEGTGSTRPTNTTTPKVLLGVVSGVLLLFVELLLFVIRTHTLDRAVRQKQRQPGRRTTTPFGEYTARTSKVYRDR